MDVTIFDYDSLLFSSSSQKFLSGQNYYICLFVCLLTYLLAYLLVCLLRCYGVYHQCNITRKPLNMS